MRVSVRPAKRREETVYINTDFIRLDGFLKFKGIAMTGGEAKSFVQDGIVKVDGEVCTARGKKLRQGNTVSIFSVDYQIKKNES